MSGALRDRLPCSRELGSRRQGAGRAHSWGASAGGSFAVHAALFIGDARDPIPVRSRATAMALAGATRRRGKAMREATRGSTSAETEPSDAVEVPSTRGLVAPRSIRERLYAQRVRDREPFESYAADPRLRGALKAGQLDVDARGGYVPA